MDDLVSAIQAGRLPPYNHRKLRLESYGEKKESNKLCGLCDEEIWEARPWVIREYRNPETLSTADVPLHSVCFEIWSQLGRDDHVGTFPPPMTPEIRITDWNTFDAIAAELSKPGTTSAGYYFRGQGVARWGLTSSFMRELEYTTVRTSEDARRIEAQVMAEFQQQAPAHLSAPFKPPKTDRLSWLATMQHYETPTRLLDWSSSPYVALYFAIRSHPEADGAVWCAHAPTMEAAARAVGIVIPTNETEQNRVLDEDHEGILFMRPQHLTNRMVAQETWFSVTGRPSADHESLLAKAAASVSMPLRFPASMKLRIPREQKLPFLGHLRLQEVTADRLFPGIDGFGRSLGEAIRLRAAGDLAIRIPIRHAVAKRPEPPPAEA
jgi:hypothetical protein